MEHLPSWVIDYWYILPVLAYFLWALASRLYDIISGKPARTAQEKDLQQRETVCSRRELSLDKKSAALHYQESRLNDQIRDRTIDVARSVASREYLQSTPAFRALLYGQDSYYDRLRTVLTTDLQISSPFDISATIASEGRSYHTTLYECSCPDYRFRRLPCKHMLRLSLEVGLLLGFDYTPLKDEILSLLDERAHVSQEIDFLRSESHKIHVSIASEQERLKEETADIARILSEKSQSFPWLASLVADRNEACLLEVPSYLRSKDRPALSKADEIERLVRNDFKQAVLKGKQAEYQLCFYESLFPWLLDFKELPPAVASVCASDSTSGDEYDQLKKWLSPDEYHSLPEGARNQLALDRYYQRQKSNWEVGIEYERYIGYLCEQKGYQVFYSGAERKLADMGRDLILTKESHTILIQCKRWAQGKAIHENHVFQLAGSVFEYQALHSEEDVSGVFVTTTDFSPIASLCAERLGIVLFPQIPFQPYPLIKCNIAKDGAKIYHLPMDLQYDRVRITHPGECYVSTVAEAEALGFRRAYRWHNTNHGGEPCPPLKNT